MNRVHHNTTEHPDIQCPVIPRDLIEYLEKVYPDKLPADRNITERELGALFGRQDVLVHLRSRFREQEDTVLV